MSVKVDGIVEAVMGELEDYVDEVTGDVKQAVKEVAKATVKEVKAKSPVGGRPDGYKKNWGQATVYETEWSIQIAVRNKKHYRLTHLLENGHALRNGDRTRAFPHIKPAEDFAARELEKKVIVKVSGKG